MRNVILDRVAGWGAMVLVAAGGAGLAVAQTTNGIWFSGREIFRIDNQISHLNAADLDGDGRVDLVVANNARAKINLLFNQSGLTNPPVALPPRPKREINELPPDARFRIESLPSEKRIAALVVADLNHDQRPDLTYYGEPRELVVQYNQGSNHWSEPKRWALEDGQLTPNALSAGDLNGDGRTDLVLLGERVIYWLAQQPDGTLGEPGRIPFTGTVKLAQVQDLNGDGRSDLWLVNWESTTPFRFRLQDEAGQLGPEIYFTFTPIRSYCADNLEGTLETQIVTVAQNSGRAQISRFTRKPAEVLAEPFRQGQFCVLPLTKTDKARRGVLWADLNGDARADLIVAEPDLGQVAVYFQDAKGALSAPRVFPTLSGVSELALADWDGDGQAELFLLSPDERQVGVTRWMDQQRLPFPTLIPVDGKPLAMAVGPLTTKPTLAVIVDRDGKRVLLTTTADKNPRTQPLREDFKANPSTLAIHDVNQDGRPDLVVLVPYEKIKVLVQTPEGTFDEQDIAPPGGSVEQPWLATLDVDGDGQQELLLAQKNFVRAVVLQPESIATNPTNRSAWTFGVKEQINGAASNSRLAGAAALSGGTNRVPSLFLLDAERKALTLCERGAAGVWQVVRNVPLPVTEFASLQPVALGSAQPNAVAFLGLNAVGWLALEGEVWRLSELDGYETPIKDGYLHDVVAGDLNNDGRKDLVFLETAKNYLDLVFFDANRTLVPANRWQVFEERSFRSRRSELPEPREALVADLTGDGKNDLAVLVHDRIIVYPQE